MAKQVEQTFWQRRWKLILNLITLLALVGLVYAIRTQLVDTIKNLARVRVWALLLLLPIEALNYDAQARLYRSLFAAVGNNLSYRFCMRLSLELNFINHVFPSGGVSGISYFGVRARQGGITGARATLIQLLKLVLTFVSFELLILVGVVALAAAGKANNLTILVAGILSTLMVVGTLGFSYVIGSRQRISRFFSAITRGLNKLIHLVRRHHPETIDIKQAETAFGELHDNYALFKQDYRRLQAPFWFALITNITEVAAVYVVFVAFGHWVNIGAVILGYAVANFAGLVSVLPGGIGVYEALMTGVLAVAGVPASLSLPVIVMYRIVNTLIQLPPGYWLYQKSVNKGALARQQA